MYAFTFPGQGSHGVGMGSALASRHPVARATFEEAGDVLRLDLARLCWEGPPDQLGRTELAQPAILTTSIAALRVLRQETGIVPDVVAGHSLGEYSALVCAEALAFADALSLVRARGRFMQDAVAEGRGAMAAIMNLAPSAVDALCHELAEEQVLSVANYNAPSQCVVSGERAAVERLQHAAKAQGATVRMLDVSAPFHCALMYPAADRLYRMLLQTQFADPICPVVLNVDALRLAAGADLPEVLTRQLTSPVRWDDCVAHLTRLGVRVAIELGHGKVLSSLLRRTARGIKALRLGEPDDLRAIEDHLRDAAASSPRIAG